MSYEGRRPRERAAEKSASAEARDATRRAKGGGESAASAPSVEAEARRAELARRVAADKEKSMKAAAELRRRIMTDQSSKKQDPMFARIELESARSKVKEAPPRSNQPALSSQGSSTQSDSKSSDEKG